MPRARFALVLIALALLLPMASGVEACGTCLAGDAGCCPPACSLCLCCGPVSTALASLPRVERGVARVLPTGEPAESRQGSFDPRDVFHVPKPA